MRRYETLLVLNPELPEAQTRETIDRARRLLTENGAEDVQMQEWGMRDLAYEIRKHKRGYYILLEYRATPEMVNELERQLRITDEALRFISVAAPKNARRRVVELETSETSGTSEEVSAPATPVASDEAAAATEPATTPAE